jgi:integrase
MGRRAKGLDAATVRTAAPGRYGDGNGLYLLVRPTKPKDDHPQPDSRFWLFRYTPRGGSRMREMGLGPAGYGKGEIPLAAARDKAGELIKLVRAGGDPLAERETAARARKAAAQVEAIRAKTFKQAAEEFMNLAEAGLRSVKHRKQWRSTLETYAYPIMGEIAVGDVDTSHVLAVLRPIWTEKTETASRVRNRIERVLDAARTAGDRQAENCARWRGHLANILPKRSKIAPVVHHPALPWQDIGVLLAELRQKVSMGALALEFTILTAARSGETLGATWGEIDLDSKSWSIPAARMKAGKAHRVPLSDAAIAVLRAAAKYRRSDDPGDLVFPGASEGRPLSSMTMTMLLRRLGRGDLTVHGFRSSFRDWAAERTRYANQVVEMALAHSIGSQVEAAYRRSDLFEKRRRLMADWAEFCSKANRATADNVRPIRGTA